MPRKKQGVNFSVHPVLAERFREATREYLGKLGLTFSAAMLMFIEADPKVQGQYIKRVFDAEIDAEVEEMIRLAKEEQLKKIKQRESAPRPKRGQ